MLHQIYCNNKPLKAEAVDRMHMEMEDLKQNQVFCALYLLLFMSSVACAAINSLPGFPGFLPFKLQTGYVGVGDVEFFYSLVESERDPVEDPLMLWLTGRPGCSALSGLFFQIGPIQFNNVKYNGSLPTLALNSYTWTKVASIIFIDAPAGTGFSYSRTKQGLKSSDTKFANQARDFLRAWLLKHPKFLGSPIYVGGDSYAGKIVPQVVKAISDEIEVGNRSPINLKGYLIGNAATDPRFDENSKIPFAHRMALISDELYKAARKSCKGEYLIMPEDRNISFKCISNLKHISECIEGICESHILEPKCPPEFRPEKVEEKQRKLLENHDLHLQLQTGFPQFGCRNYNTFLLSIWANDINVQTALHIRKGTLSQDWKRCNHDLLYEKDVKSVVQVHLELNKRGYRALVYSGDHDMVIPYLGTLRWIEALNFSIADTWRPWMVKGQVGGYMQRYENDFTFATGGGHTASEYKPNECFSMFRRWISPEPL